MNLLWDWDKSVGGVELLRYQLVTKNVSKVVCGARLEGGRIEERIVLLLHHCLEVEPIFWHFLLGKICLVRYFLFHNISPKIVDMY